MLKKVFIALLTIGSLNLLYSFFLSPDFQKYGDTNKAQWTCRVNNLIGDLYIVMSRYRDAQRFFEPILKRCPNSNLVEDVEYKMADCLEKQGKRSDAVEAYVAFLEKYPRSRHASVAMRNVDLLKGR